MNLDGQAMQRREGTHTLSRTQAVVRVAQSLEGMMGVRVVNDSQTAAATSRTAPSAMRTMVRATCQLCSLKENCSGQQGMRAPTHAEHQHDDAADDEEDCSGKERQEGANVRPKKSKSAACWRTDLRSRCGVCRKKKSTTMAMTPIGRLLSRSEGTKRRTCMKKICASAGTRRMDAPIAS